MGRLGAAVVRGPRFVTEFDVTARVGRSGSLLVRSVLRALRAVRRTSHGALRAVDDETTSRRDDVLWLGSWAPVERCSQPAARATARVARWTTRRRHDATTFFVWVLGAGRALFDARRTSHGALRAGDDETTTRRRSLVGFLGVGQGAPCSRGSKDPGATLLRSGRAAIPHSRSQYPSSHENTSSRRVVAPSSWPKAPPKAA